MLFGSHNMAGITLIASNIFIAGCLTYGFEAVVCCNNEFKQAKKIRLKQFFILVFSYATIYMARENYMAKVNFWTILSPTYIE